MSYKAKPGPSELHPEEGQRWIRRGFSESTLNRTVLCALFAARPDVLLKAPLPGPAALCTLFPGPLLTVSVFALIGIIWVPSSCAHYFFI